MGKIRKTYKKRDFFNKSSALRLVNSSFLAVSEECISLKRLSRNMMNNSLVRKLLILSENYGVNVKKD